MTEPTSFTKEEWESRDLTMAGVAVALGDIAFMALFMLTGLAFLVMARPYGEHDPELWAYLGAGVFFLTKSCFGYMHSLMNPRDNYEVVIKTKDRTTVIKR